MNKIKTIKKINLSKITIDIVFDYLAQNPALVSESSEIERLKELDLNLILVSFVNFAIQYDQYSEIFIDDENFEYYKMDYDRYIDGVLIHLDGSVYASVQYDEKDIKTALYNCLMFPF